MSKTNERNREADNPRETSPALSSLASGLPCSFAESAQRRIYNRLCTLPPEGVLLFSHVALSKSIWGHRSTPSCSSLQRNGDRIMKRMGIFLSMVMLSFSLLIPPLASAADTASSSTATHQTMAPKKSKRHTKATSQKHKASASSSSTSQAR